MVGFNDSKLQECFPSMPGIKYTSRAFYAHNVHTTWWHDPSRPEQFGFLSTASNLSVVITILTETENQVQQFVIKTPDGEVLSGWHILPLTLYAENERALIGQDFKAEDYEKSRAFKLLAEDAESRLIIYCKQS